MEPYQIGLIIFVVIVLAAIVFASFYKRQVYAKIDELDKRKNQVISSAPYDELMAVSQLNLSGQSAQTRTNLEQQWKSLEHRYYPLVENHLFEAEQAADRYRFKESKEEQELAITQIETIETEMGHLRDALDELVQREEANKQRIDQIKENYREVRKTLLAHGFSFGPATPLLESHLAEMENDFQDFSQLTDSGDHDEAQGVIVRLNERIKQMDEQMKLIPEIIQEIEEVYDEQVEEIKKGYAYLTGQGYHFPDDRMEQDIEDVERDIQRIKDLLAELKLTEIDEVTERIESDIESLYARMETEIVAHERVYDLQNSVKRSIYYLQEQIRRAKIEEDRISQSYVLIHEELDEIQQAEKDLKLGQKDFETFSEELREQNLPYSVSYQRLDSVFAHLEHINDRLNKILDHLYNYRMEEKKLRDQMLAMEQDLYDVKRRLENRNLPGLPANFLELFFSASDRVEQLSAELARPKLNLIEVRKQNKLCQEDVDQLKQMAEDILKHSALAEIVSQRLLRYREEANGIEETIRHSQKVFSEDYDYERALEIVKAKLDNVQPGLYGELVQEYESK